MAGMKLARLVNGLIMIVVGGLLILCGLQTGHRMPLLLVLVPLGVVLTVAGGYLWALALRRSR